MVESLLQYIQGIGNFNLYCALFVFGCLENLIPPVPGDTITIFGAYLVGIGQLHFFGVLASTVLGNFCGFMLLFFLGKYLGRDFFFEKDFRFFPRKNLLKVEKWFKKFGYLVVLSNRFLSGTRSVISVFAGIANMKNRVVALCCLVACTIWNSILVYAGYKVGDNWEIIAGYLKSYNWTVLFIIISFLLLFALRMVTREKAK